MATRDGWKPPTIARIFGHEMAANGYRANPAAGSRDVGAAGRHGDMAMSKIPPLERVTGLRARRKLTAAEVLTDIDRAERLADSGKLIPPNAIKELHGVDPKKMTGRASTYIKKAKASASGSVALARSVLGDARLGQILSKYQGIESTAETRAAMVADVEKAMQETMARILNKGPK